jgi:hypothetical protein
VPRPQCGVVGRSNAAAISQGKGQQGHAELNKQTKTDGPRGGRGAEEKKNESDVYLADNKLGR